MRLFPGNEFHKINPPTSVLQNIQFHKTIPGNVLHKTDPLDASSTKLTPQTDFRVSFQILVKKGILINLQRCRFEKYPHP